jgi:murein L,D-transpeptidase YcbB/YkuD
MLGFEFDHVLTDEQLYDETLRDGVKRFQFDYKHRVTDGRVGPGTRERLVSEMLHRFNPLNLRSAETPGGLEPTGGFY